MVRWSDGVAIRSGETKLLFDAIESDSTIPDLFITHAHFDHSKGFQFPAHKKRSTRETKELYETETDHQIGNWEAIRLGRRLQLGNVEVEAHDAGHILGSVQFEIIAHDENLVYASHLNFNDTLLTHAAEVAPCDALVIEAAFPPTSQKLPPRESVVANAVKWVMGCVREHRVPALATETIGTAQELIRVFNTWTGLTVIVHPRIARTNQVYQNNGTALSYIDAGTEEAQSLIEEGKCVLIVPRRFDVTQYGDFRVAYATGWPTRAEKESGEVFLLSDQADLDQLLMFVKEARPKTVFTFRGGSGVLAELVSKKLGITGRALSAETVRPKTTSTPIDEEAVKACENYIAGIVQVPNLTYDKRDLMSRALAEGFKIPFIEEALNRMAKKNVLRYSQMTDGYSLP